MTHDDERNGWPEYQRLVMAKLESLEAGQKETRGDIANLRVDMGVMKVKAGMFGAIAGTVPTALGILWYMFTGRKN